MIPPPSRKSDRPTIADVAEAAGLSVATVDRVINGRLRVRAKTAARVRDAATAMGFHAASLIVKRAVSLRRSMTLGFLLQRHSVQFYEALGAEMALATESSPTISGIALIEYLDDLRPANVAERLKLMATRADAIALVAADYPQITRALADLREVGKPVLALLSDLSAPARAGYVGVDWRKTGRTVGWAMSNLARTPGHVAIIIGSYRYLATEVCEISFRTYLREHAPHLQLLEPLVNFEEPRFAYQGTLELLQRTPDLVGIYMVGGGVEGVMDALRESNASDRIVTVCHDLTKNTREGLMDGVLNFLIHQPREALAAATVRMLQDAVELFEGHVADPPINISDGGLLKTAAPIHHYVPIELYTVENI